MFTDENVGQSEKPQNKVCNGTIETELGKLIKYLQKGSSYRTLIGKEVMWYPVQVPQGESVLSILDDVFTKYKRLIRRYKDFSFCFDDNDLKLVDNLCDSILGTLNQYLAGSVIQAYQTFSKMMDLYIGEFPDKEVEDNILFYRMRKDLDLKEKEEFFHLPTNLRELCSSERFSIAGYPCFYIGYSKNDCLVEISKTGSMIGLTLNESDSLKVLDLTFSKEQEEGKDLKKFLKAFPLIASCYVVMMNNVDSDKAKFREEYVIPQMLTSYLKNKDNYDGICYYSVRNENLNPLGRGEDDYRNLVLFTNLNSADEHDKNLMDKFHWYNPFNVR